MWRRKPQRPPLTYERVRLVAEVLTRINADLIQRHFAVSADTAQQFMERLVQENALAMAKLTVGIILLSVTAAPPAASETDGRQQPED